MEENKIYIVRNKYWIKDGGEIYLLCPKNECRARMREITSIASNKFKFGESDFICPNCQDSEIHLGVSYKIAKSDIESIIASGKYKKAEIIDIDGVHTPVLKKKVKSQNNKYFASVQINESKRGPQLVIYAGKRGHKAKTQIFVTPETKKMSFDHKDIQPTEIFTKVTAQFDDETVNTIGKTQND